MEIPSRSTRTEPSRIYPPEWRSHEGGYIRWRGSSTEGRNSMSARTNSCRYIIPNRLIIFMSALLGGHGKTHMANY